MFQTGIILILQSLTSEPLNVFMNLITSLGDDKLMAGILILVTFGINFRNGVLLMQFFQWTKIITDGFKFTLKMPRPTYVHGAIQDLQHKEFEATIFTSAGADSFFGPMDSMVLSSFRSSNNADYGFPSGHASQSAVFWFCLAMLYKKRSWYIGAALIAILVAFSRVYLGRHFVGDVVCGLAIAGVVFAAVLLVSSRSKFFMRLFERTTYQFSLSFHFLITCFYNYLIPLGLAVFAPDIFGDGAGYLFGVNTSLLVLQSNGFPSDQGSFLKRLLRVFLGAGLYFATERTVKGLFHLFDLNTISFFDTFLASAVPTFVCFTGCVLLGYRLKLYTKKENDLLA